MSSEQSLGTMTSTARSAVIVTAGSASVVYVVAGADVDAGSVVAVLAVLASEPPPVEHEAKTSTVARSRAGTDREVAGLSTWSR